MARNEAESPRGRIAQIRGLAGGQLTLGQSSRAHLDSCLHCLSCEAMCPAGVQFGELMDLARAHLLPVRAESRLTRLVRHQPELAALGVRALRSLGLAGGATQDSGTGLRRMLAEAPSPAAPGADPISPGAHAGTPIALFSGCVSPGFARDTLASITRVLNALGQAVVVTPSALCCGALDRHLGRTSQEDPAPLQAFLQAAGTRRVLVGDSGCQAALARLLGPDIEVANASAAVLGTLESANLELRPARYPIALHHPCTLRNELRASAATERLLARIPGLVMSRVQGAGCCGAAGSGFLEQPELSDDLRARVADEVVATEAPVLVTSNIGCRMFVGRELERRRIPTRVIHPLTVISEHLP